MELEAHKAVSPEHSLNSVETDFKLDCAYRIDSLVIKAAELIDRDTGMFMHKEDGQECLIEVLENGYWQGVSISTARFLHDESSKAIPWELSNLTLERNTDGRSKITLDQTTFDTQNNPYEHSATFELSLHPYQTNISHTASGLFFDPERRIARPPRIASEQEDIKNDIDALLAVAESTVYPFQQNQAENPAQTQVAPKRQKREDIDFGSSPHDLPPVLERPVARTLQVISIIDAAEQLSGNNNATDVYMLNDGFYEFSYRRTTDGRYAKIYSIKTNRYDINPDTGGITPLDGDEKCLQLAVSSGGTICATFDMKTIDERGYTRNGRDEYTYTYVKDQIKHTGSGFTFDLVTGALTRNKEITDQDELKVKLHDLLDAVEHTTEGIIGSLYEDSLINE